MEKEAILNFLRHALQGDLKPLLFESIEATPMGAYHVVLKADRSQIVPLPPAFKAQMDKLAEKPLPLMVSWDSVAENYPLIGVSLPIMQIPNVPEFTAKAIRVANEWNRMSGLVSHCFVDDPVQGSNVRLVFMAGSDFLPLGYPDAAAELFRKRIVCTVRESGEMTSTLMANLERMITPNHA